jgi:hypothetical protein
MARPFRNSIGALVVGVSRGGTGGLCRGRSVDARLQCGVFLPCRRIEKRLRTRTSIAPNARAGIACAPKWMECRSLGHYGQSCLREQLYSRRLSAIPTANSVGLAKHIVLAQIHQVKVCRCRFRKRKSIRWGNSTPPENSLARWPKRPSGFFGFPGSRRRISACRSRARSFAQRVSGMEPYLLGPAVPRRQPISTNPQIVSARLADART